MTVVNVTVISSMKLTIDSLNIHISHSNMESLHIILHNNQSLHQLVENPMISIHNSSFGKLDLLAATEAVVTNCHIIDNVITKTTLISSYGSSVTIVNCSFLHFKVNEGPAVLHARVNSTIHLTNTAMIGHESPQGAILVHTNCSVKMKYVNISYHRSTGYGFSAVMFLDKVKASIYDSVFESNSAVFGGVFLASHNSVLECNGCVFADNQAVLGGVILVRYSSKLVITYSAILDSRGLSHNKNSSTILQLNGTYSEILLPLAKNSSV